MTTKNSNAKKKTTKNAPKTSGKGKGKPPASDKPAASNAPGKNAETLNGGKSHDNANAPSNAGRNVLGHRIGTRASAIDAVLIGASKPLTTKELTAHARAGLIGKSYEEKEGKPLGGVGGHLRHLTERGLIVRQGGGYVLTQSARDLITPPAPKTGKKKGK